jgi:hypothetical protein
MVSNFKRSITGRLGKLMRQKTGASAAGSTKGGQSSHRTHPKMDEEEMRKMYEKKIRPVDSRLSPTIAKHWDKDGVDDRLIDRFRSEVVRKE